MLVSVLIPSYCRPMDLARALVAQQWQSRPADQIVVVARTGDTNTIEILRTWREVLPLEIVEVTVGGVVQAMNAGLVHCSGDIVAITDDDAVPRPDWLTRIIEHFQLNSRLGGVGGRDWVHQNGKIETGDRRVVGKCRWYGRVFGNHHLGSGNAREVDVLKGANCAFRTNILRAIGFETRLRGQGAQVHWEMCLCFAIQSSGWRLLYDPNVAVDHYPAKRSAGSERGEMRAEIAYDTAFNFSLAIAEISSPKKRIIADIWENLVGTVDKPGCISAIRLVLRRERSWLVFWRSAQSGRAAARSLRRRVI